MPIVGALHVVVWDLHRRLRVAHGRIVTGSEQREKTVESCRIKMGNCGGRDRVASEDEVEHRSTSVHIVERGGISGTWVPTHAAARILPVDIRQKSQKGIGGGESTQPKKPGF